jgi:hypothetical protein
MKQRCFSKDETFDFFFPLKKSKRRCFIIHVNRRLTDIFENIVCRNRQIRLIVD